MQQPTADEVYKMMANAIGEKDMSPAMKLAYKSAPDLLVDHGISCEQSIKSENNALVLTPSKEKFDEYEQYFIQTKEGIYKREL